jgi:DNA-binding transcriptional LysR family regulator
MLLRQLEYLVALARERHFARAAAACCVSQPALSAGIQQLEKEFGIPLFLRGKRFEGLTAEGERILKWARETLAASESLRQEAAAARQSLTGTLRLGAIPTTMPIVSLLTGPYRRAHPDIQQSIVSLSNAEILRRLNDFELDLGLTYLDDQPPPGFRSLPLYRERYLLVARDSASLSGLTTIGWDAAAKLPLCLLNQSMQNRRIIDAAFRRAGVGPVVAVEADSVFALYSHVHGAQLFSIIPHSMLGVFEMRGDLTAIPLTPELTRGIGLVAVQHDPISPLVAAAWSISATLHLDQHFDRVISAADQAIRTID